VNKGDATGLRVQLLGPVRAWRGDEELSLGGPQRRAVLGMLAMHAHQVVRGELIDGMWDQDPPASAVNSVHVHVVGLRRVLEPRRARRAPGEVLAASGPGYQLRLEPGTLDTEILDQHLAHARGLTAGADPAVTVRSLEAALGLWQGAPLAGIPGPWAEIERIRLEELRQSAIEGRIDALLALGRHHLILAELAALIRQYPLRERFHGQLMLALYRCGRQADALAAFADARRELAGQLGIDPGSALRRLHQQILTSDTALNPPPDRGGLAGHGAPAGHGAVPRELPGDVDTFVGRTAELSELDRLLPAREGTSPRAALISAVAGSGGVGKTALAVHWGHRVRDAFPGGQLYVNLRGYDPGEPVTPADALARFLRSLGLTDHEIPSDVDETRCQLSQLAGRAAGPGSARQRRHRGAGPSAAARHAVMSCSGDQPRLPCRAGCPARRPAPCRGSLGRR
jgi:DNA-binding SARP family transcriptional activator